MSLLDVVECTDGRAVLTACPDEWVGYAKLSAKYQIEHRATSQATKPRLARTTRNPYL